MSPTQSCPVCQRTQPLRQFRRIHRGKSRLCHVCNTCDPPKTIKQMTKRERLNAIATTHRHVSPHYILAISDRERTHHNASVRPQTALRQWARARRIGWDQAVLARMRAEMHWARQAIQRYAKNTDKYKNRIRFLAQYWDTLKYIRLQMENESKRYHTPTIPDPALTNPRAYITKEEYRDLKQSYIDNYPIEGTHPARDPWLLTWQDPEETTGEKSPQDEGEDE